MRIAVTGGTGFIGSCLVRQLQQKRHEVTVLDVRDPKLPGVHWRPVDITSMESLQQATEGVDVIYHLAAVSNVNTVFADPIGCAKANLLGTENVLESARLNKLHRVIFASTVWVYNAIQGREGNETACFLPERVGHLYTASKIAGEMLCHSYWQLYKVPFTILRYGIPYGPGMRPELVIAAFIKKALNHEPITVQGDGKQYRKFVYVDDLAEGNVAALATVAENQTYNLDGAEKIAIIEIAQALDKILGGVNIQYAPSRAGDFAGSETSSVKAEKELGWKSRTTFEKGLRKTLNWFMEPQNPSNARIASAPK